MLFVKEKNQARTTVPRFTQIAGFARKTKLREEPPGLQLDVLIPVKRKAK